MFGGWLTGELAPHLFAVTAADTLRELTRKRRDVRGLALAAASAAGLGILIRQSMNAEDVVETALNETLGPDYSRHPTHQNADLDVSTPWYQLAFPLVTRNADVETTKDIAYGQPGELTSLDVYRRKHPVMDGAPVLVHVHGGMWMSGDKKYEGLPLMLHMAAHGWVCVNVNYRLSPKHPFPAQIIDIKRAIAWIRDHGAEYGADPAYIAISGGSAGGHLAALAALTPGDPEYQPGFEDADTSVQAAVPHYGIYDFAAVSGTDHALKRRDRFLSRFVLKKDPVTDREDFE
ncbi:MAG: alpha/beta hydrolase, partial [Mycobacteriaceae bacterium]